MRSINLENQLVDAIAGFAHDPLGFVRFAYPWGEEGTELADATGPRDWQCALLAELGRRLREAGDLGLLLPILMARASGHGVGKSTVAAWILHWALSTMPNARIVLTANTDTQLRTKSWPEVAKWMRLAINRHWFRATATAVYSADPAHERLWRADAIPWSEENTEAFAGLHNKGRRVVLIFDEASAIADKIWEVSEGALTDEDTESCGSPSTTRPAMQAHSECAFGGFATAGITRISTPEMLRAPKDAIRELVARLRRGQRFFPRPRARRLSACGLDAIHCV